MTSDPSPSPAPTSEFGKGLCYCLGLFLAHAERLRFDLDHYRELRKKTGSDVFDDNHCTGLWFHGSADHLFEFQPDAAPEALRDRCKTFQDRCLEWRLPTSKVTEPTPDDAGWAIEEAKELLRLIDEAHGVETLEATWK